VSDQNTYDRGFLGSETFKGLTGFLALILSATAAFFAYSSDQQAADAASKAQALAEKTSETDLALKQIDQNLVQLSQDLDRTRFAAELTSQSLPYLERMVSGDTGSGSACHVVVSLSRIQIETTRRSEVSDLLYQLLDSGTVDAGGVCTVLADDARFAELVAAKLAELVPVETATETDIQTAEEEVLASLKDVGAQTGDTQNVGEWHAVMASYRTNNCALAQEAARAFHETFGASLPAKGGRITIARTSISDHFAVTIDTGADKAAAEAWATVLRDAGRAAEKRISDGEAMPFDRTNLRYLTGAFVQENRGWSVDPSCPLSP